MVWIELRLCPAVVMLFEVFQGLKVRNIHRNRVFAPSSMARSPERRVLVTSSDALCS